MHPSNDPDDPSGDPPTPDSEDRRPVEQPFCRVFGGPTSHRVQYAGPESRPATGIDRQDNLRSGRAADRRPDRRCDGRSPADEPSDADVRTAGGRAIAALLERRLAALERALEPVRRACWRGESPDVDDLREVRVRLAELQVAVEEHLARACPDAEPWEMAGEHIPEARLRGLIERGGRVRCADDEPADGNEPGGS